MNETNGNGRKVTDWMTA